jgi:RimJ/RimL family protein N-acetyltransferase
MDSPHRLQFIESKRLRLLAANQALVSADLSGREALAQALGVRVPENWPPELYDRPPMEVAMLQLQDEVQVGWSFWYMVQKQTGGDELLGICGFKGLPDPQGEVEIGYSILSHCRNTALPEAVHPGIGKKWISVCRSRFRAWRGPLPA